MLRQMLMAAALVGSVVGSVGLSAQTRNRADRPFDDFGQPADDWCRDAERGNRDRTFCDVREQSLPGIASLDVDTGGNGGIRVHGTSGATTRVRFRVVGRARDERDARDIAEQVQISTDGGRIRVRGPVGRNNTWWNVDVEIESPRDLPLTLVTNNGGIAIDDVSGRTRFETSNGGVSLTDVSGDVRGRTVNGGISVRLDRRWNGDGLDVETTNGGVCLMLPADFNADLHAETTNGGIDIDFPITVQGRLTALNRRIDTTLGAGGPRVRVRTVNGGVRIAKR
jgi:hypothetical protein